MLLHNVTIETGVSSISSLSLCRTLDIAYDYLPEFMYIIPSPTHSAKPEARTQILFFRIQNDLYEILHTKVFIRRFF